MVSAFCWYMLVIIRGRMLEITTLSVATLFASSTTDLKSDNISVVVLGESQSLKHMTSVTVDVSIEYQPISRCTA